MTCFPAEATSEYSRGVLVSLTGSGFSTSAVAGAEAAAEARQFRMRNYAVISADDDSSYGRPFNIQAKLSTFADSGSQNMNERPGQGLAFDKLVICQLKEVSELTSSLSNRWA